MSGLFYGYENLLYLPDLSQWNIKNDKYMKLLFCSCFNLKFIPDISNWNTENLIIITSIFCGCKSTINLAKNFILENFKNKLYELYFQGLFFFTIFTSNIKMGYIK